MNKTVFLTGASGFLGGYCLRYLLESGYTVHAISRRAGGLFHQNVTWHELDLLESRAVEDLLAQIRPSHLMHLAWTTQPGYYWHAPENLDWVAASLNVLRAFVRQGGKRVLMAGSCAEYEWKNGVYCEKNTPLLPATPYGASKKALFELLERYQNILDYSFIWGRLFFLYGPGEHPSRLLPSVISSLLAGQPVQCTHGRQQRDFLHVDDAARALVMLLNSEHQGPANVASGVPVSIRALVSMAAKMTEALGYFPGRIEYGAIPLAETEPMLIAANTQSLRHCGFSPRWTLEDGLRDTIAFWQKNALSLLKEAALC